MSSDRLIVKKFVFDFPPSNIIHSFIQMLMKKKEEKKNMYNGINNLRKNCRMMILIKIFKQFEKSFDI